MRELGYQTSLEKINGQILEYEDFSKGLQYMGGIEESDAKELFHKFKELFDEAGIKFSLGCGSLLGAVRNGTIIPGDGDMDVYTWEEEKLRAHLIEFYEKGLKVCRIFPGLFYTFQINTKCRIDVDIYRELTGVMSLPWRRSCISIEGFETPRKFFTGYREIEFLGEKVLCPENPERLLEFWFGPDWRIPQNKKGIYRVRSAHYIHQCCGYIGKAFTFIRKGFKFMFNKRYRQQILWRIEKNGTYRYKWK